MCYWVKRILVRIFDIVNKILLVVVVVLMYFVKG